MRRELKKQMMGRILEIIVFITIMTFNLSAQNSMLGSTKISAQRVTEINSELLSMPWTAKWISYPDISGSEYGVYLYRKEISINTKPDKFIIHVSADNRYKLYINGSSGILKV